MGATAENVAKKYGIPRAEQEAFAVESQRRAAAAQKAGRLADEIVAVGGGNEVVSEDGCIRPDTTAEALAGLKPAFDAAGTVTRSEEHTSELQSLMRISYAVFCLK